MANRSNRSDQIRKELSKWTATIASEWCFYSVLSKHLNMVAIQSLEENYSNLKIPLSTDSHNAIIDRQSQYKLWSYKMLVKDLAYMDDALWFQIKARPLQLCHDKKTSEWKSYIQHQATSKQANESFSFTLQWKKHLLPRRTSYSAILWNNIYSNDLQTSLRSLRGRV